MPFGPPPRRRAISSPPRRLRRRPIPTATPAPAPTPVPHPESPASSAFRRRRAEIEGIAERLKRTEFGGIFARDIKKLPKVQVVERIGTSGGREIGGQTFIPRGRVESIAAGVFRAVGLGPGRSIRISARTTQPEAAVRHEVTHGILSVRGIPPSEQHRIQDLTRVKGQLTTRMLPAAIRASTSPSEIARGEGRTMLQRFRLQAMARGRRKKR